MKTTLLTAAVILCSAAAFAQSTTATTTPAAVVKTQMKDLRKDIRTYDKEKAATKIAVNKGDLIAAKADIAIDKTDKAAIKADAQTLKSEGVAHPVTLADKQVKAIDRKEVRTDVRDIHVDKVAEQKAVKSGDITSAQADQQALKADRMALKKDVREAHRDGVKHRIHHAK